MNLNEEYDDRDALLRALDSNILETQGEDGAPRFRWNDPERAAMQRKLDLAARDVERERNRRAQLQRFKEREERAAVESQLVDAARKLNCCESALRDVKRLAPLFKLNDEGVALSEDAKLVSEVLQEEIALSPHWLKRSQGGDAEPGELPAPRAADDARFRDALADPDVPFADLLRLAPRLDRARPF